MRVQAELVEPVPGDEAPDLQHLVFELALDAAKATNGAWLPVALKMPPSRQGMISSCAPGALQDRRQRAIGEIGVGAGEVENEFDRKASRITRSPPRV